MNIYFAPMEGLTDWIYRRLHHKYFPGVDCYFTPFFSPTVHRSLTAREQRELPPAPDVGFPVVPQLLTKNAEDFLWMTQVIRDRGYTQVNLNLGCPSGTVVSKGKGSGMLADPESLERFLDAVFAKTPLPISVKTRVGLHGSEEFPKLMELLGRYPLAELIVHPRTRVDFYDKPLRMECFRLALAESRCPVCFNGNLVGVRQIEDFRKEYPGVNAVMLGRGLIGDPGMVSGGTDRNRLEQFCNELLEEYLVAFGGSRNAMFRLKENWRYLLCRFDGSEKLGKRLRKTTDLNEYRAITAQIFALPLKQALEPDW